MVEPMADGFQRVMALWRVYIDGAVAGMAPVVTLSILAIGLFSTKRIVHIGILLYWSALILYSVALQPEILQV